MITYVVGNLFESPAQVLVNTVNIVGVMGKGIAKEFKAIYPAMFQQYQQFCETKRFDVGQLWLYKTPHKWVLNFPTKKHWKHPSKVEYIEAGLAKFASTYQEKGITSIAFPMLGCGNGDLDWERQVRPLMEHYLKNLMCDVYIYQYSKDGYEPEHRNPRDVKAWLQSEPVSLPFNEVADDIVAFVGQELQTHVDGQAVRYYPIDDPNGDVVLKIQGSDWAELVEDRQLFAIWQQVRTTGFFTDDSVPNGLSHVGPQLYDLFSRLPYLKPVLVARNYHELTVESKALQLVAPTRPASSGEKVHSQVERVYDYTQKT